MTRLGIHKKVLVKLNNKMIYLILLYLIIPCFHHVNFDCGIKSIPNGRKGQIKISQNQICSKDLKKIGQRLVHFSGDDSAAGHFWQRTSVAIQK